MATLPKWRGPVADDIPNSLFLIRREGVTLV